MISLNDYEELAKARYEIERATIDCAELSLFIGEAHVSTLTRDHFEFSVEWGKLIFAWWGEGVSQSWRVTAYEIVRGDLRLQAVRGMVQEMSMLTLRDPARRREIRELEHLPRNERREIYAETLARLLTNHFDGAAAQRLGLSAGRTDAGRYARLILRSASALGLAIGVSGIESQADIDGMIAAGLVWLARFNEKRIGAERAKWICFCLPKGRLDTAVERLTLLDVSRLGASLKCCEVDEDSESITGLRPATQDELLNSHSREVVWPQSSILQERWEERWRERIVSLAPDLIETRRNVSDGGERFMINGLEFARSSAGAKVKFGIAGLQFEVATNSATLTEANFEKLEELARELIRFRSANCPDRRHPFYLLRAESWLESLLRRDICQLDATLDDRFVYPQIPAWRANERSVIDLLTLNCDGRLVVIEIKAAEDPQLPLQGTDYWLRVEQGRLLNEFEKRGLFQGVRLADQSPLLYLVAPRLRFHRTFATVAQCLTTQIEAYQIGINANWREGLKVHTRERVNVAASCTNNEDGARG
jgi:hypothetical protein